MSMRIAGKFKVLRRLAEGGMAEVFLASQSAGIDGFEKLVVIKRILPGYAQIGSFVRMFLDEARMAADLRHPNIVNVFEVGEDGGSYYIAMEFLHGQNLRQITDTCTAKARTLPLGHAVHIVLDVASALHYAHGKKDLRGNHLEIIHRDVSPQNILVTYEGAAKLLDFGIAKAAVQTAQTQAGAVKGKAPYMSPEQITQQKLDCRSDLYSLGIVLFELTTGHRLFKRERKMDTVQAVFEGQVPRPRTLVPGYPRDLEAIVLKALAYEPSDRFLDGAELACALEEFLASSAIPHSNIRVAQFMRELYGNDDTVNAIKPSAWGPGADDALTGTVSTLAPTRQTQARIRIGVQTRRTNVTRISSSFVGRSAELDTIAQYLSRAERIVAVTGEAGIGKTRLAQEAACAAVEAFDGGVWFCDLSEAETAEEVNSRVRSVLGVPHDLASAFRSRGRTLLVLDGCLVHDLLSEWTTSAPELRIIATARSRIEVPGARQIELSGLPASDKTGTGHFSEAVQLFVEHAKKVTPDFTLTEDNATKIAQIVRDLGGNPRAIELAASRASQSLDMFDGEATRPTRLEDAIELAWSALEPWERATLAQCTVFRGGFSVEAADEIIDVAAYPEAPWTQVILESLRDRALISAYEPDEFHGGIRFRLEDNVREIAAGQAEHAVQTRHARYYLNSAETWAAAIGTVQGVAALRQLALERENLVEIHRWACGRGAAGAGKALRVALVLQPLAMVRGPLRAHVRLLDAAMALTETGVDPALRARAHCARAKACLALDRFPDAENESAMALAVARRIRFPELEADAQVVLGDLQSASGNVELAGKLYGRALKAYRRLNHGREGAVLIELGRIHQLMEDYIEAERVYVRALSILKDTGNKIDEARVRSALGSLCHEMRRNDEAMQHYEEALRIAREIGDRTAEARHLGFLGLLAQDASNVCEARDYFAAALAILQDIGARRLVGFFMACMGANKAATDELAHAERMFESAAKLLTETDDPLTHAAQVLQGHLDLAMFRVESGTDGNMQVAMEHWQTAYQRVVAVKAGAGPGPRPGTPELRIALHLLTRSLGTPTPTNIETTRRSNLAPRPGSERPQPHKALK